MSYITDFLQVDGIGLQIFFKGTEVISKYVKQLDELFADYKSFWAADSYKVYRVVAGYGIRGRLIATCYYITWRIAEIEWFHSFYRRIRKYFSCF